MEARVKAQADGLRTPLVPYVPIRPFGCTTRTVKNNSINSVNSVKNTFSCLWWSLFASGAATANAPSCHPFPSNSHIQKFRVDSKLPSFRRNNSHFSSNVVKPRPTMTCETPLSKNSRLMGGQIVNAISCLTNNLTSYTTRETNGCRDTSRNSPSRLPRRCQPLRRKNPAPSSLSLSKRNFPVVPAFLIVFICEPA